MGPSLHVIRVLRTNSATTATLLLLAACHAVDGPRLVDEPALRADSSLATYNAVPAVGVLGADEALLGGATTVFRSEDEAFEQPAATLDAAALAQHDAGDDA
ncbi:MAG: hypothetical protein MUE41_17835, partial [Gemmatimonadaceae bacterium]|nr:hypothetical protein [Gemmatimonadaceae bacterium]